MRQTLQLLLFAFVQFTASADVLIYQSGETSRITGSGREMALSYSGYWVVDLNNTNVSVIQWTTYQGYKSYRQRALEHPFLSLVQGKNRSFSFLTESLSSENQPWTSSLFIKGQNQKLVLGTGITNNFPRTMGGTWQQVFPDGGSQTSWEKSLRLTYAETMTKTNNNAGNSVQTILDGIVSRLQKRGYQPDN